MTLTTQGAPAPKVMQIGASGTGKTYSIRSLVDNGFKVAAIFTEPGFQNVLGDLPEDKMHWVYLPPAPFGWDVLTDQFQKINTLSFEMLTKLGGDRTTHNQAIQLISVLKNFVCQRTGKVIGDIGKLDNSWFFVIDSLSGLSTMAVNAQVGIRPALSPSDYGVIQKMIENLVNTCCFNLTCGFLLTAHLEREFDEVTGAMNLMASTVGKKLAPKLPRFFDEVIHTKFAQKRWSWSTATDNVDTKTRLLSISDTLDPNFKLMIQNWRTRTGTAK